jgi:hypothetical protein
VGNLAIRTGKRIDWNVEQMKVNHLLEADQYIHPEFRKGWTVKLHVVARAAVL